jgi:hypothetical protein
MAGAAWVVADSISEAGKPSLKITEANAVGAR